MPTLVLEPTNKKTRPISSGAFLIAGMKNLSGWLDARL